MSDLPNESMIVRFLTRRFIGEYDSNLEKIYTFNTVVDNDVVLLEILDTARYTNEAENVHFETNIRWADAFILIYSVTDKCSFDECNRLKFLINYNKRRRKISPYRDGGPDVPVILVANKIDQYGDRMVSLEEGIKRFREIGCACFHEISVRESIDQVWAVFRDAVRFYRVFAKYPKLRRSTSDVQTTSSIVLSPDSICSMFDNFIRHEKRRSFLVGQSPWAECSPDESDGTKQQETNNSRGSDLAPFRGRASTDGTIASRPKRWQYPPPGSVVSHPARIDRRMSISMRGSNASY